MQAFHFSLETLLKVRKMEEEQLQVKLAEATAQFMAEKEQLELLKTRLAEHINKFRNCQNERVGISTFNVFHNYHDKLKGDISIQQERVELAQSAFQQCLASLEQAVKARKLVEKLREKRMLEYQTECLKEEQKFIDEQGLQVFSRNK
ncbi:MAG: flagellar export protein FliJ [Firmicutes bacterium]|nr:flagellar export protein FliJ [Bacillota bacterium]